MFYTRLKGETINLDAVSWSKFNIASKDIAFKFMQLANHCVHVRIRDTHFCKGNRQSQALEEIFKALYSLGSRHCIVRIGYAEYTATKLRDFAGFSLCCIAHPCREYHGETSPVSDVVYSADLVLYDMA